MKHLIQIQFDRDLTLEQCRELIKDQIYSVGETENTTKARVRYNESIHVCDQLMKKKELTDSHDEKVQCFTIKRCNDSNSHQLEDYINKRNGEKKE
jgi:hypothetical protein